MSTSRAQFWIKTSVLSAAVVGAMMLSGCGKKEAETVTLNIGFQKYGILPIVKERGTLETALKAQNVQVKWVEFPAGPQLLEGLNVGSVVFGEAGKHLRFSHKLQIRTWFTLPTNLLHLKQKH